MKIKIIADDKIPFLKGALEDVAEMFYCPGHEINREMVKNADAIITRTRTNCNEELLKGSSVKFIATATIGYDHIDTRWCEDNGISWTNAAGCNSSSVEQYIVSTLLSVFTHFKHNPAKLTLGVVGVGNVGTKVAKAANLLGLNVLLNDPPRQMTDKSIEFCNLEHILENADIISFHTPLTKSGIHKTYHLADDSFFDKAKKKPIIINTSRGSVVSQISLKKSLKQKLIKASILDVWEGEPFIDSELLAMSFIGTPHIAGYSTDGKVNGTVFCVNALSEFFNLGINWYPDSIPTPDNSYLECDCDGKNELEIIREIYLETYDVLRDDKNLRSNIDNFEYLRGNYPLRREPSAYNVKLLNCRHKIVLEKLEGLGFNT
jgi:erythronate-4-phosphate dehydrogenase